MRIQGFVLTALYGYSHIAVDNLFLSFGILLLLNGKVLPVLLAAIGYCGFQGRPAVLVYEMHFFFGSLGVYVLIFSSFGIWCCKVATGSSTALSFSACCALSR